MTPLNLEVGMSASTSSGAQGNSGPFGDFVVSGSGTAAKQNTTFYIVAGVVGLIALLLIFRRK